MSLKPKNMASNPKAQPQRHVQLNTSQGSKQQQQQQQSTIPDTIYKWLLKVVGYDIFMLYGDTGTGKTSFAIWLAKYYARLGKTVLYIDTEKNLDEDEFKNYGNILYIYQPNPDTFINLVQKIADPSTKKEHAKPPLSNGDIYSKTFDLYIIDSIGFPIFQKFAVASMDERGRILSILTQLAMKLKIFANVAKAQVLVIDQPSSPFGKNVKSDFELLPFGGKSRFAVKEKWITLRERVVPGQETICGVYANISRRYPPQTKLFEVRIYKTQGQGRVPGKGIDVKLVV
ncbi:MAG: AAA family ATPase [Crenarchaeota archaeon]|nr:AAA family ATPase [Thermoproteota archaeon]